MQNFYDIHEVEPVRNKKADQDFVLYSRSAKSVVMPKKYFEYKNTESYSKLWDKSVLALKAENSELLEEYLSTKNASLVNDANLITKDLATSLNGIDEYKVLTAMAGGANSHYFAIDLATSLNQNAVVVTGFVNGVTTISKNLHSWVETELDGEEVVLDMTINSVVNKEHYYSHRNVEVINSVSNADLKKDGETVYPYIKDKKLSYAAYLTCREEVLTKINESESANE